MLRKMACVACLGFALPGAAQDGPLGIAFVQAPEMASGMAMARTPGEGFAAATAQCVEGGALAQDCIPTNWCQPPGWSIDLFVMHQEGIHWHEVVCGLPSRASAEMLADMLCAPTTRDWLSECLLVQVYNESGVPQLTEN